VIEPYTFLQNRGITPSLPSAFLDTSGADDGVEGTDKPSPLYPIDEAEGEEKACVYHIAKSRVAPGILGKEVNHWTNK